jgi:hypothetical protein
MREGRQVAARTDAPLLRNERMNPRVQHAQEELDELRTRAGVALGDDIGAQEHHGAHFTFGQRWTNARRMAAYEVDLEIGETVRRY